MKTTSILSVPILVGSIISDKGFAFKDLNWSGVSNDTRVSSYK